MELVIVKREKNELVFEVKGETHTFCNALRQALIEDKAVTFAAYKVGHPLNPISLFMVKTDGSKTPEEALAEAAKKLVALLQEFKEAFNNAIKT
ncbi:MAG: DNA-directed RNA polymerase subunit L [Candidatus Nezhaarchaeales archaeon]